MVCEGMRRKKTAWGEQTSRHAENHSSQRLPLPGESHMRESKLFISQTHLLPLQNPGGTNQRASFTRAYLTPTCLLTLEMPSLEVFPFPLQTEAVEYPWEHRLPKGRDLLSPRFTPGG